jgi:ubiquinone/menaquinone biosynthesis C-methylase UbiE
MSEASPLLRISKSQRCCSLSWEEAYARFETPKEEIAKFRNRLLKIGAAKWDKNLQIVELFCGRGNGLHALTSLGFEQLEGADLSEALLAAYQGPAKTYVCDCRYLPFESQSRDVVIVQGGLHHLPALPDDLDLTLAEMRRILRPNGFAVIIEPWETPFLRFVHAMCDSRIARRLWPKLDALAAMIENERTTYEQWLSQPQLILRSLKTFFPPHTTVIGWGKIQFLGSLEAK